MLKGRDPRLRSVPSTWLSFLHLGELLLANGMLHACGLIISGRLCALWPHSTAWTQNRISLLLLLLKRLLLLERLRLLEILDLPGLEPTCCGSLMLRWSICLFHFLLLLNSMIILCGELKSVFINSRYGRLLLLLAASLHHHLLLLWQRLTVHPLLVLYLSDLILHLVHDIVSIILVSVIIVVLIWSITVAWDLVMKLFFLVTVHFEIVFLAASSETPSYLLKKNRLLNYYN